MPSSSLIGSVAIGRYGLTVGAPGGTLITPGPIDVDAENADLHEVAAAIEDDATETRTVGELAEGAIKTAAEATTRVEQAEDMLRAALAGKLVDLDALPARAEVVFDVLQYLDRNGRLKDWLRFARAINGVLTLAMRWADLVRMLGAVLRTPKQARAATAWAQHELGNLHLAIDDLKVAERLLAQARETWVAVDDQAGLAGTEQSLGVLCRRRAGGGGRRLRERLLLAALISAILLVIGGVAGAVVDPFDPDVSRLTVRVEGAGVVTTASAAIRCPRRCDADFDDGRTVSLTASAQDGSTFAGWRGDCGGAQRCRLTMDEARTAIARFSVTPRTRTVTVVRAGDGDGRVTSPSGIDCPGACRTSVERGSRLRLDATPAAGSTFGGWSGGDCGRTGRCRLTVRDDVTITVQFTARPADPDEFILTVIPAGEGRGIVSSKPSGISCGGDCSEPFPAGRRIALNQTADENSVFTGWSGPDCSGTGACRVTLTQAQSVKASFARRAADTFVLTTSIADGSGSISPNCADGCRYPAGTVVPLTATPEGNDNTVTWSGCDDGTECEATMAANRTVQVTFSFNEP
jgi:hypothetical protein